MANTDKPSGLKPLRHLNGNPWNGMFNVYYHSSSDGTAIYLGDVVQIDGTNDETTGKYPSVTQHVATQTDNVGVVVGFGATPQLMAISTDLNAVHYCPASTEMYIAVVDDPDVVFEVQEDSDGAALTAAAVGGCGDIIVGSGSSTTGVSAMELDSSSVADTSATLQVLRLVDREDNAIGNNAKWEVLLREHLYRGTTVIA